MSRPVRERPMMPADTPRQLHLTLVDLFSEFGLRANTSYQKDASEPMTHPLTLDHDSPAQITAQKDDYDPGSTPVLRLASDAARSITGMVPPMTAGGLVLLFNVGGFAITLEHEHASSAAENRFIGDGAADVVIPATGKAYLWYDSTSQRWRAWL